MTCGITLVGGKCCYPARRDDPLCVHHAGAIRGARAAAPHLAALRSAGCTLPTPRAPDPPPNPALQRRGRRRNNVIE